MGEDNDSTHLPVLESLVGFLHVLDEDSAEVTIIEDTVPSEYQIPSVHFTRLGIREGDSFYVDVIRQGGQIRGAIRRFDEMERQTCENEEYLTPEQLRGLSDRWD